MGDIDLAVAGSRDLNVAARVADNEGDVAVVKDGCRWAKVADTAWEEIAVADDAREELGVADNRSKEVAVADFVEDNLVPRTGTEVAEVVVIPGGEAGRNGPGAHAAEVDAQAVEYAVL